MIKKKLFRCEGLFFRLVVCCFFIDMANLI